MQRDGYNKEDALSRIAIQIDIEQKKQEATYVIDNSKDLAYLNYECARVKKEILGDFE
jgi:dephospho-CoA kinase